MYTMTLIPGLVSDATVWQPLADAAAARSVHADLTAGQSITGWAERLLAEVEGPILAVGHSMGGRVALEMARLSPDRIVGLVLANTGHHPRREGEEAKRQTLIDTAHRDMDAFIAAWLPPMLDPARARDAAIIGPLSAMVRRAGPQVHERQIRALLDRPDASAHLATIACPVLLVAARQDGWSPIAQHREIADAVRDGELAIIENAGHFAPVERPAQTVVAITAWLGRKFGGLDA